MRSPQHRFTVVSILILALASEQARADVFAAVNVAAPPGRTDFDIAIVNASLGTRVALPPVVNTTAFEIHPSISSDGRRLVFQRFGGSDGTRLLLVDTSSGQSADLFTPTEIALNPIFNSAIKGDGTTVATGRRFRQVQFTSGIRFVPEVTLSDVRSFPTGPFPRTPLLALAASFGAPGSVLNVAFGGNDRFALHLRSGTGLGQLALLQPGRAALLSSTTADLRHPAMRADDSPSLVPIFYEHRSVLPLTGAFGNSNLGQRSVRPEDPLLFGGTSASVFAPGPINTNRTSLSRRSRATGATWHSSAKAATDTIGSSSGTRSRRPSSIPRRRSRPRCDDRYRLGVALPADGDHGEPDLDDGERERDADAGGEHRDPRPTHRRRDEGARPKQYELETVGRFPLGEYGAGNVFTHWDFEVEDEPLAPGKYLVTLRAVEGDVVRELGEPQVLKIDPHGSAHFLKESLR